MTGDGHGGGRLILHVGLPKAASSALQFWCDGARDRLAAAGVSYPDPRSPHLMKKHAWLVPEAVEGHATTLAAEIAARPAPVVIASNEGFSARYPQFRTGFRDALARAAAGREIVLFVMTREAGSWARSLWAQAVLNAPMHGLLPEAQPFETFALSHSIRWYADIDTRAAQMQALTGAARVVQADAGDDWLAVLTDLAGVPQLGSEAPPRIHSAAPVHAVELVRRVNALRPDRAGLLRAALLAGIAAICGPGNMTIDNTARNFAGRPEKQRQAALRLLTALLAQITPDPGEMATLHADLRDWAARPDP